MKRRNDNLTKRIKFLEEELVQCLEYFQYNSISPLTIIDGLNDEKEQVKLFAERSIESNFFRWEKIYHLLNEINYLKDDTSL